MAINPGKYAYRFNGSAMKLMMEFHLIGVGILELKANGTVSGFHTASITPLKGSNAAIEVTRYTWSGSYGPRQNGLGPEDFEAKVTFTSVGTAPVQKLEGTFSMVPVDSDRVWLISTGTTNLSPGRTQEDEVVSGEAVRFG